MTKKNKTLKTDEKRPKNYQKEEKQKKKKQTQNDYK